VQFIWFRRYALQDTITITLNAALLFVVLFYVYPLKFLFTYLASEFLGGHGMAHLPDGRTEPMLKTGDGYLMMLIYNLGFISVFLLFVLLYWHAWRKRDQLELDAKERALTKQAWGANICFVAVGFLSTAMILIGGERAIGLGGMTYMLIGPVLTVYHSVMGRRYRKL
jgi:uncharacterized paraquat-inducible protein A